jgi:hypothetical protein
MSLVRPKGWKLLGNVAIKGRLVKIRSLDPNIFQPVTTLPFFHLKVHLHVRFLHAFYCPQSRNFTAVRNFSLVRF